MCRRFIATGRAKDWRMCFCELLFDLQSQPTQEVERKTSARPHIEAADFFAGLY